MIKINAEDHTPYDQDEDTDIKITSKKNPKFTFEDIDDVVNKVTVSVSKSKEKNADPKTIKYTKIPEGKWKNDEDDQGYNSNQIPILFQEDGEYNMTLKAETTGGLEATSNRLTLGVYAGVMAPSIAVESKDELEEVLSGTATPTFEIKNVDPHAREIHITATPGKEGNTQKSFKGVLDKNGGIKSDEHGVFEKITGGFSYKFKPVQNWEEGIYSIRVSVINKATQPSLDSSTLALIINTSKPAQPSITLSDTSNTTHPTSLQEKEKWTSSRKPTFTIDLKDNNTDNPIKKVEVEVMVTGAEGKTYIATKEGLNNWSPEINEKSNKKGTFSLNVKNELTFTPDDEWKKGEYSLSVKTYNSVDQPSDVSKTEVVNVNDDQPDQPKIELAYADQTGKEIDASNTNITNNPNPGFAISNINLERDSIDKDAVTITITKESKSIIPGAKVTYENGGFSYNTTNFHNKHGDGEYTATVRVTNKAGIPSDSTGFRFEIDTTAPNPPEIDWTSGSFVTMTNPTDKGVLKTVATREEDFVVEVKTDTEIDAPRYITATLNQKVPLPLPVKKEEKEGKNIWKFTFKQNFSTGKNGLSVEVKDKAGNKNTAQGDFMVLEELPAPKIDMNHNTNAAGQTSTPYMINKVNMVQNEKRKLNISLDDNTLFPYVEMKAELISAESSGSSYELSIKKNPDTNWTVEIPGKQADGKYRLKVIATDVLKRTQETEVDFVVDTTPPNIPEIELVDESENGKSFVGNASNLTLTYNSPQFKITFDEEDMDSVNIKLENSEGKPIQIKSLTEQEISAGEYIYKTDSLNNTADYILTVTATDKAGNQSPTKKQNFNINTTDLQDVDILLYDKDKTGDKGSNFTKNKNPTLIFRTKEENINKIVIYQKPQSVSADNVMIAELKSDGSFQKNEDQRWKIPENIFNKEGKYIISARPYKGKKQGPKTEIAIDFYQNAPEVKDIQLNAASKSTFDESGIYTNEPTPGFLITVPDGDEHRVWKMQVLVIKQSTENPLETINITENIFPANRPNSVNTQKP
ncbi:hypothetical protein BJP41_02170 [Candidatus Williamhamiltonella defendens]|uniref:Bacterial Ig-like domain-containing protein n=1 Tax=Candidatus Williamhamiltonella defendens TaxID=138072 RepID=A0A2D3T6A5_9ENTR|nr:Ig-like domain-containing protein [Candidatus Hamiltonella defensa]ATW29342.1 hypothetical protein BJP41_02170 [Candidatus Hamiltonella defensa]ATW31320.1 hypothetical protein BJP42_02235 [Candidatus Hamiltonella defensa]